MGINKEIFCDFYKVNVGMIDICIVELLDKVFIGFYLNV